MRTVIWVYHDPPNSKFAQRIREYGVNKIARETGMRHQSDLSNWLMGRRGISFKDFRALAAQLGMVAGLDENDQACVSER